VAVDFSAIVSLSVSLFVSVSSFGVVESKSRGVCLSGCQSFVVSEYRGVRVSGCAVKILTQSLVRLHFC
jgi:hypothetical protein